LRVAYVVMAAAVWGSDLPRATDAVAVDERLGVTTIATLNRRVDANHVAAFELP
jgi:hypothetical protein